MKLRVLPGRVAVLYPVEERSDQIVQVPAAIRRKTESLMGAALECRRARVLSSGFPGVCEGDTVAVRCDAACLALEPRDYDFVPPGHEVRIYGVHEDVLNDDRDVVMWRERA